MKTYRTPPASLVLMLVLVVLGALACEAQPSSNPGGAGAPATAPVATMTHMSGAPKAMLVGPMPLACEGALCLQVYDLGSGEYFSEEQSIAGFEYAPGFVWQVLVTDTFGSSTIPWQLSSVLSQERAAGEVTISAPQIGDALSAGGALRGTVQAMPSDGQLIYRVYDAGGMLLGSGPIHITPGDGVTGTFAVSLLFDAYEGPGRIEVMDLYGPVGFVGRATAVDVYLGMASPPESRPTPLVLTSRSISVEAPASYASVTPTFEVRGIVTVSPFESTLGYHVFGGDGRLISAGSIQVQAEMGQPGTFTGSISLPDAYRGPARLVIFEASAADGLFLSSSTLEVFAAGEAP